MSEMYSGQGLVHSNYSEDASDFWKIVSVQAHKLTRTVGVLSAFITSVSTDEDFRVVFAPWERERCDGTC